VRQCLFAASWRATLSWQKSSRSERGFGRNLCDCLDLAWGAIQPLYLPGLEICTIALLWPSNPLHTTLVRVVIFGSEGGSAVRQRDSSAMVLCAKQREDVLEAQLEDNIRELSVRQGAGRAAASPPGPSTKQIRKLNQLAS
jgi:hypothetical protein